MFHGIQFPYFNSQQLNLDWIVDKIKGMLSFLPDDGTAGQILRRTADGAEWSDGGGGAVDSVNGQTGAVVLDKTDIGLGNVANVVQYSASNPPPYPVTSVNGQTGAVTVQPATDAQVTTAVNTWLGENVAQETGYVLDSTLTMSNAAPPASAVGDLKNTTKNIQDSFYKYESSIFEISSTGASTVNDKRILLNVGNPIKANVFIGNIEMMGNATLAGTAKVELATLNNGTYTVYDSVMENVESKQGEATSILTVGKTTIGETYVFVTLGANHMFYAANVTGKKMVVADNISSNSFMTRNVSNYEVEFKIYCSVSVELVSSVEKIKEINRRVVIVSEDGTGQYETVIDAVANEPENSVIVIKPGIYTGTIQAFNKRIVLIGTDRNKCILKSTDGRYAYPALNCSCGYIENITFISEYVSGESEEIDSSTNGAYAVHCESEYGVGDVLELHHCTLKSDFAPAIGVGLRKDFRLILDDCDLSNNQIIDRGRYTDEGTLGALYIHDSNGEQGNQYVSIKNCVLKSSLGNSLTLYQVTRDVQNNKVYCNFINNVLFDEINRYSNNVLLRNNPFGSNVFSIDIGYGNSNSALNN